MVTISPMVKASWTSTTSTSVVASRPASARASRVVAATMSWPQTWGERWFQGAPLRSAAPRTTTSPGAPDAGTSTAAAAPSEVGQHCSRVSGSAIMRDASTSSTV